MAVLSERMTKREWHLLTINFLISRFNYVASQKVLISHYYFLQGHFLVRDHQGQGWGAVVGGLVLRLWGRGIVFLWWQKRVVQFLLLCFHPDEWIHLCNKLKMSTRHILYILLHWAAILDTQCWFQYHWIAHALVKLTVLNVSFFVMLYFPHNKNQRRGLGHVSGTLTEGW